MKRFALLLVSALLVFACNNNDTSQGGKSNINLRLEIDQSSRVEIVDNRYVWQGDEQLGLYIDATPTVNNLLSRVEVRDGIGYATADAQYQNGDMLYGYMPYNAQSSDLHNVSLTIPAEQSVAAAGTFPSGAMPMVAEPSQLAQQNQTALKFYPLGGFLRYNIYTSGAYAGEKVRTVRYATSKAISGTVSHDITSSEFTLASMSGYSVSTSLDSSYAIATALDKATPIYMVVAPGNYTGTLTITTDAAIYSYNYSVDVARNRYYDVNIDLSKALYRKTIGATTSATATLTYSECADVFSAYNAPKSYKNSYGTWTICAYNYNKEAIQLNSGKVAYVGTPTFASAATKVSVNLAESYSGDLYICTAAGGTSATGIVNTVKCGGTTISADISSLNLKSFYIRSSACMRIASISIVYGADSGSVLPDPTPEPDPTPDPDPTPNPDPDPTPDPTPTPTSGKYGWVELPVINDADGNGVHDTDSNIYYAHHLCAGGEKNAQRNGTARNFTVCYSAKHHCPLWVAAPRHSMYEQKNTSRTDAYGTDPKIPSSVQYNSKSTGGGCNKGHMLGSAERLCSAATNRQVFYYTNIAPQYSSTFNTGGGAWNNLEDHIDGLVCSDTLYVVVGCYFESFARNGASASPKTISFGGRNDVSCPTMYYYALLRTKSGNSGKSVRDCSASELQCAAFTICHEMAKGHKPEAADMMSISDLERLTGFTYFQNVPNAPKSSYSASDWL